MRLHKRTEYFGYVLSALVALTLFAAGPDRAEGSLQGQTQAAQTPGCTGTPTPAQTEGPYYRAGSPERTSLLEANMGGTKIVITGVVYDRNCRPVANAWLDFWQTDDRGAYDNVGYRMRGHQFADSSGRYRLETVIPGEYPGRTPHIHVKFRAPNGTVTTSQLYFPGSAGNENDNIFNPALLVQVQDTASGKMGTFNFVLSTALPQTQPTPTQAPSSGDSYTFRETGIRVSGAFWTTWRGSRTFEESLYINGLPITTARDETSPTDGKPYNTQWFERARFELHPQNQPPNNVLLGLLGVSAAQGRQNEAPFRAVSNPGNGLQWFSQTGHTLGDTSEGGRAIAAFWTRLGGLSQFGYPLSQPFTEVSKDDGKPYLVQYFERQRFEYHPENKGTRFEVLLGRLGAEQVKR
jgi:protocatechuate 3,4-dioxygenase beta subunit